MSMRLRYNSYVRVVLDFYYLIFYHSQEENLKKEHIFYNSILSSNDLTKMYAQLQSTFAKSIEPL